MRTRKYAIVLLVIGCLVHGQSNSEAGNSGALLLKAHRVLDIKNGRYIEAAGILIQDHRIQQVGAASEIHPPNGTTVLDLGPATVFPGLIDCHTHLMARIPGGPDGYILNLAIKSEAFRALEGAADARATLEAGFTTVRDVENEGSGYADVALRDAINQGLVEGPRMQVATRAIAAVGQYNPFGVSPDLTGFPTGAQMISGIEDAQRAVREQIGHGADLIKVYADWSYPTLTVEEMTVIVGEAHKAHRKVAAHATTAEGVANAISAGVDSIEHGHFADRRDIEMMKAKGTYWVLTIGYYYDHVDHARSPEARKYMQDALQRVQQNMAIARELGVKIANGFDASSAAEHGENAHEIVAMTKLGMPALEAVRAATTSAAELLGWQDQVGSIEPGKYADLIAFSGDPLTDIAELNRVKLVMKGGTLVKNEFGAH